MQQYVPQRLKIIISVREHNIKSVASWLNEENKIMLKGYIQSLNNYELDWVIDNQCNFFLQPKYDIKFSVREAFHWISIVERNVLLMTLGLTFPK